MIDFSENNDQTPNTKSKWAFSITHIMVISFTCLSFIPLVILLLLTTPKIEVEFQKSIENELIETSKISKKSIEKWFNELLNSVEHEAQTQTSKDFITTMTNAFLFSSMELNAFTQSDHWEMYASSYEDYYNHFSTMHEDFYDIFLVDNNGNILFTLEKESDLGTNLTTGVYKDTLFAKGYLNAINSNSTQFSDLEYYAPSNNTLSGFIISPISNNNKKIIGAIALQINFETALNLHSSSRYLSLNNYLINEDLFLRNKVKNIKHENILNTEIINPLTTHWKNNHFKNQSSTSFTKMYKGINETDVIGIYHTINLGDKNWAIIYEINEKEIFTPLINLKITYQYLFTFITIIAVLLSYYLAKKISNPIKDLNKLTQVIRTGESTKIEEHKGFKESNELADNLKKMIEQQQFYENALDENRKIAINSLKELKNIQFAMDQHSIITITNIKGDIIYSNDKFSEISGYSKEELLNQNHRLVNSNYHDNQYWRDMYLCISKNNIWHGEIKNKNKQGADYWVQSTIVPIMNHHEKIDRYIAIRTDITDRKLSELELLKAKELAESAVIAKSEFLASMSHEIRTPMNGILGMLNILKKSNLDENQNHKVSLAKNSAKGLLTIINDILDFSKIEAGKLDIEHIEFNLINLLGEVSESIALNAQEKDIDIILDYQHVLQENFIGDPGRIKQILFNLIGNAVKFTKQGNVTIEISTVKKEGNIFTLKGEIIDTGIGIKSDKLSQLFEKFTQADNSTTREFGGTGLGLAIVKQLVQLMGGNIHATSVINEGSRFIFDIEIKAKIDCYAFDRYKNKYKNKSILIIDNNLNIRENLENQFNRFNLQTHCIDRINDYNPDSNNNYDIAIIDESQIHSTEHYNSIKDAFKESSILLIVMTKTKSKSTYFKQHQYKFNKPVIFQDILYCLDNLFEEKTANENIIEPNIETENTKQNNIKSNILLVEDNFVNQQVALSLLEELNIQVEIAQNGEEALKLLNDNPKLYQLILMDCQMPIMDGYTAAHQIRLGKAGTHYSNTPIIALTANAMKGDKEKCIAAGMDDYLSKPIDQTDLENKLNKYLN